MLNNLLLVSITLMLLVMTGLAIAISSVILHYLNELLKVSTRPYHSVTFEFEEDGEIDEIY